VYLVNDSNMLVMRPVKVGVRTGDNWVITEGLQGGERIAVLGNAMIDPKVPVVPKPMEWDYARTSGN
jgi:multidrug efflux pump subunit AcrA (membrane-fusion protein)